MGGCHPYEVSNIEGYYQFYQRACYSQVWDSLDHHDRWRISLHIRGVQEVRHWRGNQADQIISILCPSKWTSQGVQSEPYQVDQEEN
jgi:hypothetical protein